MGAPLGNQNGARPRHFSDTIARLLLEKDGKRLRAIVSKLLTMAESGNETAMQMVMDRMEGKVKQQMEMTGLNDGPIEVEVGKRERARRVAFILAQVPANDEQANVAKEAR